MMKKLRRMAMAAGCMAALLTGGAAQAQPATTHDESGFVPDGYELTYSDEFDGTDLNTQDWKFEIQAPGWVNNEQQRYVGKTFQGNKVVFVEDDHLTIRCQKVYTNSGDYEDGGGRYSIVSGRLNLRPGEGWRYGYFEARIKLPKGKGTWPAFWMMPVNVDWSTNPWPRCGEIDIMEEVGVDANQVSSSIHCDAYNHTKNTQKTHAMYLPGAEDDYHVYGLEWTSESLTFYVDGQVQLRFDKESDDHAVWPFHYAFHPILNLAWGGSWGGYKGVDESALPCEMLVDYVRIYKKPTPATAKKVVAYVTSWSNIMPDPTMMTHINYAFGGVSDACKVFVEGESRFRQIVALKERNPELKVLLSVGGWGRGKFTPMAASEEGRKTFAQSCRQFCDQYGIDGIDIDWEFPGNNSSGETSPADEKQNYTLLMRDLREALGDDLLLTMASSSSPGYYDYWNCIQYLDFVNVMTYDMASPPQHHSALYRGGQVGNGWKVGHESIQEHLNAGIPAEKLVMGLAFYGNGNGDGSGSANQVSLQEIEDGISSGKWTDHWDDVAKVPYVTNTQTGAFVYGYDNARSLGIKCQYILDQDLAGGMYWEYNNDNLVGTERSTVYDALIGSTVTRYSLKVDDQTLDYVGGNRYRATLQLVQGQDYTISGAPELEGGQWYADPAFFVRQADGTFRFVPVSGAYEVEANFADGCFRVRPVDADGLPLTYNTTDGTGCIWLMGNDGIGKPSYAYAPNWGAANGWTPTTDMFMAVPMVSPRVYRMTLTVDEQLRATNVNFKFFHQAGYGNDSSDEFNNTGPTRITTTSDRFRIDTTENGNIKLRPGASLTGGDTYVFTIDATDPQNVVLITDNITAGISTAVAPATPVVWYDLQGRRLTAPRRGINIANGQKVAL